MEKSQGKRLLESINSVKKVIGHNKPNMCVSQGEFFMLKMILEIKNLEGNVNMSSLSAKLGTSNAAVSQMISGLETKDLVARTMSKLDRRIIDVAITNKGEQFLNEASTHFNHALDMVAEKLGKEDTEQLIHLMDKLCIAFDHGKEVKNEVNN